MKLMLLFRLYSVRIVDTGRFTPRHWRRQIHAFSDQTASDTPLARRRAVITCHLALATRFAGLLFSVPSPRDSHSDGDDTGLMGIHSWDKV